MKKNKKSIFIKILLTTVIIFIAMIITAGTYFYIGLSKLSENSEQIQDDFLVVENENNHDYNNLSEPKSEDNEESINILALGVDVGTPGSKNERDPKRTDTMLLIHYDKINKAVSAVSIPRDTLIKVNGKNMKINSAHAIGGVQYAVDAVEKLLKIDIDYYGKVNYEGFREIVDSVGGIEMEIEQNMEYDDPAQDLHIHFKKGEKVHLDGEKAEGFFRWRKNNDGTGLAEGDLGRIKNQHIFISKFIDKLQSPKIIPRIPSIFMTLPKYIETNMSADEIIKYGYSFIRSNNIKIQTIKGDTKYINGISYFIYNKNKNKDLLMVLNNIKIDEENDIDKNNIKIKVLNGSGETGLAASYRVYLKDMGYNNVSIGNAEKTKNTRVLINKAFDNNAIERLVKDFKIENYEKIEKNNEKFDIIITLGKNNKVIH